MGGALLWQLSWSLALLFLGFSLGILSAWIGAKLSGTGESMSDILKLTGESTKAAAKRTAITMTIPVINVLIAWPLIFGAGYAYRGDIENRARYTYKDVLIVARHSDHEFTIQPARMIPWDTDDLCDPEDWQPNQKLISMSFSVRYQGGKACKDVERGGEWYRYMKDGKPILFTQETIADGRH